MIDQFNHDEIVAHFKKELFHYKNMYKAFAKENM